MIINRREALAGAGGLALAMATGDAWAAGPRRVRKSASSLSATSDDVMAFGEAIKRMKGRRDGLSWETQVKLHADKAEHNNWRFLPWHRLQVTHMERIVAQITGHTRFAMPYWDWQVERFLPSWITNPSSPLYERDRDPAAATLDFNKARFAESGDVALVTEDGFSAFCGTQRAAGRVEGFGHNIIHVLVGGLMADPRTATRDPIFWLHHCNVDRVWATWQRKNGNVLYPSPWKSVTMTGFTGADGRQTGNWQAQRITETASLGYQYDALYAPRVFAVGPGALARSPAGSWKYDLKASPGPDGKVTLIMPEDAMERLRDPSGRITVQGEAFVSYPRTENLAGRAINVTLMAGAGRIDLGTATTFVHMGGEHGAHHDYAQLFTFGDPARQLAQAVPEPIRIVATTEDLRPGQARAAVRPSGLDVTLTLTKYV